MLLVARVQVVFAAPRVGVDEQQALVLARERTQHFEQQHVLVDVGEVAGVILVAILHGTPATLSGAFIHCRARRESCRKAMRVVLLAGASLAPLVALRGGQAARRRESRRRRVFPIRRRRPPGRQATSVTFGSVPREVRRAVVADAARRFKVAESAVVLSTGGTGHVERRLAGLPAARADVHPDAGARVSHRRHHSAGQMVYHTDSHGFAVTCGDGPSLPAHVQPPSRTPPDLVAVRRRIRRRCIASARIAVSAYASIRAHGPRRGPTQTKPADRA